MLKTRRIRNLLTPVIAKPNMPQVLFKVKFTALKRTTGFELRVRGVGWSVWCVFMYGNVYDTVYGITCNASMPKVVLCRDAMMT